MKVKFYMSYIFNYSINIEKKMFVKNFEPHAKCEYRRESNLRFKK